MKYVYIAFFFIVMFMITSCNSSRTPQGEDSIIGGSQIDYVNKEDANSINSF